MSYQGILGAAFADAHLLIQRFKDIIQLKILQASLEWLHGDVMSGRRNRKSRYSHYSEKRLTASCTTHNI